MFKRLAVALGILALVGLMGALTVVPTMAHKESLIDQTLNLTVGDMFFQLQGQDQNAPINLKAGQLVRFVITNTGKVLHDLHFGKDPDLDNRLYKTDMIPGFDMLEIDSGQSIKLTMRVPADAGEWELGCFQIGHYESGQHAKIIITK